MRRRRGSKKQKSKSNMSKLKYLRRTLDGPQKLQEVSMVDFPVEAYFNVYYEMIPVKFPEHRDLTLLEINIEEPGKDLGVRLRPDVPNPEFLLEESFYENNLFVSLIDFQKESFFGLSYNETRDENIPDMDQAEIKFH